MRIFNPNKNQDYFHNRGCGISYLHIGIQQCAYGQDMMRLDLANRQKNGMYKMGRIQVGQ
jgi:hypothetical protein